MRRDFLAPGAWASVFVEAELAFDAEARGRALIEGVLDRLALEAQYSLAFAPDGTPQPFERSGLFADPTAEPVALVVAARTGRRWFRVLREVPMNAPLAKRRVRLEAPPVGSDRRFDEALRAWRRAVRAVDPIESVGAIWEAIEFYVAKVPVPALFPKPALRKVRRAFDELDLTKLQAERITAMLEFANSPPLLLRLRKALERVGVPYSDEEIEVLRRLRKHRNDFIHGRTRADPTPNDLDLAKAFVNRMLAFRAGSPRIGRP